MNRNQLKVIASISMLIDHIGWLLLPDLLILRILGRFAYPIFAFFISEGMHYSHDKKKYIFRTAIFALISQIPYTLIAHSILHLNILFSFALAESIILFIDKIQQNKNKKDIFALCILIIIAITLDGFGVLSYGCLGILLILNFHYIKDQNKQMIFSFIIFIAIGLSCAFTGSIDITQIYRSLGVMAMPLILIYNHKKGEKDLKKFFYIFYPAHLMVIYIIHILVG